MIINFRELFVASTQKPLQLYIRHLCTMHMNEIKNLLETNALSKSTNTIKEVETQ